MGEVKDCCKDVRNLVEIERRKATIKSNGAADQEGSFVVRQCQKCNCKHHELSLPPLKYGVKP